MSRKPSPPDNLPLNIVVEPAADADIANGYAFMQTVPGADAERWLDGITELIGEEAKLQANLRVTRRLASTSSKVRRVYLLLYRTPGGSPWHIHYELTKEGKQDNEMPDTLHVVKVRHAQAEPEEH